ncbi:hypothetical protein KC19_VG008700 [Ceratodon purpureus]|uniref:Uncharacterized protein n=1 Tax=Ceratodon purpureus TaxID=3225 RepID=A0A8T0HKT2_CERPU|nr:hypothetical protein KC19_N011900 [Ceratodon purpureus]KAG0571402.1 hypothetical protein KC19_VG008700 [Ceratodon purpureus]
MWRGSWRHGYDPWSLSLSPMKTTQTTKLSGVWKKRGGIYVKRLLLTWTSGWSMTNSRPCALRTK